MENVPIWGWIVIAVMAVIFFTVVIILILRGRGMEIKLGNKLFKLDSGLPGSKPQFGCNEEQLEQLVCLDNRLASIYDSMKLAILVYMANDLNVPRDSLSNNDDLIYIRALLWQITYGKNGKHSIRTILEDYIIREKFQIPEDKHDVDKTKMRQVVMRELIPQLTSEMMILFDDKYDNEVTYFDVEKKESHPKKRALHQEQITKLLREHINIEISPIIETLFDA